MFFVFIIFILVIGLTGCDSKLDESNARQQANLVIDNFNSALSNENLDKMASYLSEDLLWKEKGIEMTKEIYLNEIKNILDKGNTYGEVELRNRITEIENNYKVKITGQSYVEIIHPDGKIQRNKLDVQYTVEKINGKWLITKHIYFLDQ